MKVQDIKCTSIEEKVIKPLRAFPLSELTKEEAQIFIQLYLQPKFTLNKKDRSESIIALTEYRIKNGFQFTVDDRVLLLIGFLGGSPGGVILYCWYLQAYCKDHKINYINFDTFYSKIFANGVLNNSVMKDVWESQKIETMNNMSGSDNLVDYVLAGASLFI